MSSGRFLPDVFSMLFSTVSMLLGSGKIEIFFRGFSTVSTLLWSEKVDAFFRDFLNGFGSIFYVKTKNLRFFNTEKRVESKS